MSSRCAPALHYKVSGIGRFRLPTARARIKSWQADPGGTPPAPPSSRRRFRWAARLAHGSPPGADGHGLLPHPHVELLHVPEGRAGLIMHQRTARVQAECAAGVEEGAAPRTGLLVPL